MAGGQLGELGDGPELGTVLHEVVVGIHYHHGAVVRVEGRGSHRRGVVGGQLLQALVAQVAAVCRRRVDEPKVVGEI